MKLIGKILTIFLIVLVVLVLARNVVIKAALEGGSRVAGMPLSMQKFDLDILNTTIDIEGLVLKNPAGFHDTTLIEIPKILVAYQRASLLTGKLHFKTLEFDMKQFNAVKNEKGELNLDKLKALQGSKSGQKPAQPAQQPKKQSKPMPIQIDLFHLKVGKASYIDYSSGKPSVKDFNVGLDETYRDITDTNKLVSLIVFKVMTKTPLALLTNFDVKGLQGSISGVLGSATDMAGKYAAKGMDTLGSVATQPGQAVGNAGQALKGGATAAEDQAKKLGGTITGAASDLKKKIKIPF